MLVRLRPPTSVLLALPSLMLLMRVLYQAALPLPLPTSPRVESSDNCTALILETRALLEEAGLATTCSALELEGCKETFQQLRDLGHPQSVLQRSRACSIALPSHPGELVQAGPPCREGDPTGGGLPPGLPDHSLYRRQVHFLHVLTMAPEPRNLEVLLASIFLPHNAHCIHVDPKADPLFLKTVKQMIGCYK